MTQTHYMRTVPDSHFWGHLEGIINTIEHDIDWHATKEEREERIQNADYTIVDMHEPLTTEHLLIGLRNCLEHKYEIKQEKGYTTYQKPVFTTIKEMIDYLNKSGVEEDGFKEFLSIVKNTLKNKFDLKCERKMERSEVYDCIDTERQYQDLRWSPRREKNDTPDAEKPPAEWINYMEYHLDAAKVGVYKLEDEEALAHVRKVAALAVRCLELHGCPKRVIPEELLPQEGQ